MAKQQQSLHEIFMKLAEELKQAENLKIEGKEWGEKMPLDLPTLAAMIRTLEHRLELSTQRLNLLERIAWVLLTALAGYLGKSL